MRPFIRLDRLPPPPNPRKPRKAPHKEIMIWALAPGPERYQPAREPTRRFEEPVEPARDPGPQTNARNWRRGVAHFEI